jgi:hypothetical protein
MLIYEAGRVVVHMQQEEPNQTVPSMLAACIMPAAHQGQQYLSRVVSHLITLTCNQAFRYASHILTSPSQHKPAAHCCYTGELQLQLGLGHSMQST